MSDFINIENLTIDRVETERGVVKVLYSDDGDELWTFDGAIPNDFILQAAKFANSAYIKGRYAGEQLKMLEIRRALGVSLWESRR